MLLLSLRDSFEPPKFRPREPGTPPESDRSQNQPDAATNLNHGTNGGNCPVNMLRDHPNAETNPERARQRQHSRAVR